MVKVALATDGQYVAAHFGDCPAYTLAEVKDGQVKSVETIPNPGHRPGFLPTYLSELGVTHVIAGGMGPRAQELFAGRGITTIIGVQGTINEVLDAFTAGRLRPGEALASPVIRALRRKTAAGTVTVVDCPPGTACPVVQAVRGVDYCLVVTEPTPFGQHDLEAVVRMLEVLGIPCGVIINRADLGDNGVENFCRDRDIPVLGRIPFDRRIARCFAAGKPFVREMPAWEKTFARWWGEVEGAVARARNRGTQR